MSEITPGFRSWRWTVIQKDTQRKSGEDYWVCECDCGTVRSVRGHSLRYGKSKSCGCYKKEVVSKVKRTHGDSVGGEYKNLYLVFKAAKKRCTNPGKREARWYSRKEIVFCDEWSSKNGYESFKEWAIKSGYSSGLTLDRINNNKGYSPDNCRWVSMAVQSRNRRDTRMIEYKGKTQCLTDWAKEVHLSRSCIDKRLKEGFTVGQALGLETTT